MIFLQGNWSISWDIWFTINIKSAPWYAHHQIFPSIIVGQSPGQHIKMIGQKLPQNPSFTKINISTIPFCLWTLERLQSFGHFKVFANWDSNKQYKLQAPDLKVVAYNKWSLMLARKSEHEKGLILWVSFDDGK